MQDLKLALCQLDLVWENKEKNLDKSFQIISKHSKRVDLIVFPEMFTTGFSMNAASLAETIDGHTIAMLQEKVDTYNCAISGSIILKENDRYYNSFVYLSPFKSPIQYHKQHLFSLGKEDQFYTSGNKKVVININGWNILPQICYDLRFPESHKNQVCQGEYTYDLLLFVANWPDKRIHHWDALLKARAIENQSYSIGVNRVGTDAQGITHQGNTSVFTANGDRLRKIKQKEQVIEVKLNYDSLKLLRRQLPFLKDAMQSKLLV